MQFDDLAESEIPRQARRRYNSSFFRSTRSAAALKSSPGVARRSTIAARARSSGARPSSSTLSRAIRVIGTILRVIVRMWMRTVVSPSIVTGAYPHEWEGHRDSYSNSRARLVVGDCYAT